MIYSCLFLEKNEKLILLFLITYKNNLLELYAFCICCHWFYENLILKTKKVLRNIAVYYNKGREK